MVSSDLAFWPICHASPKFACSALAVWRLQIDAFMESQDLGQFACRHEERLHHGRARGRTRRALIRERILRDPESAPYLLRKHHSLMSKGRASKAPMKKEDKEHSILEAYKRRVRELREEGGEPT